MTRSSIIKSRRVQKLSKFLLATISVSAISWGAPVYAQSGGQDQASAGGLVDIVVTARKRTETAQSAPVAITALSGEHLQKYAINSLEQVAATTPQLQVTRAVSGSSANMSLRGIGSSFSSAGIEQSVAVIVDGVYYGAGQVLNEGLFDSERIEILKGPQALFFGKNATAGAISVTTADPTSDFDAMVRAGYEFRSKNAIGEAFISGPLTDTLSARVAIRFSHMFGGYYQNGGGDSIYRTFDIATFAAGAVNAPRSANWGPKEKQLMGRVSFKWEPSNALTARLKFAANDDRTNDPAWNAVPICVGNTMQLSPAQSCDRKFVRYANNAPREIAANLMKAKEDGSLYNRYKSYSLTNALEYNADPINLTWVTNYHWNRNIALTSYHGESPFDGAGGGGWGSEASRRKAFSSEARILTSFDSPVNFMAGVYYQKTNFRFRSDAVFTGLRNSAEPDVDYISNRKDSTTKGETLAGYGQIIWKVVPTVELNAGVRYTHETKDSDFIQTYSNPGLIPFIYIPGVPVAAKQTWNKWSPEVTLSWRPSSNITVYGGYKTGYKSGGFSNSGILGASTPPGGLEFAPETAKGFEGGVKTTLFDNQFRFNVGFYRYTYRDLQIDFWNSAILTLITTNAGSAVTKGIEIEAQWSPRSIPGLDVHGTLNFNKANYRNYEGPCWTGQTILEGCSIIGPAGALYQDLSGKPTANAPKWTASLGASYNFPIQENLEARLSVDSRYSARYNFSSVYDPSAFQKSYVVVDATASIATSDNRWEFAIIGKNLTNKRFISADWAVTNVGGGTGTNIGTRADLIGFGNIPRTVEARVTWRY